MTLSSPDTEKALTLTVRAEQPTAMLTVMDHSWRIIAEGIGSLTSDLPPGLYKIEAQLSRNTWSKHVSLRNEPEHVHVPFFGIKSAVPSHVFTRSHEYHEAHLNAAANRTDVKAGTGARILMVARNWSPGGNALTDLPGLTLERWRGDELANLEQNGSIDRRGDTVGSCAIEINPGAYVVSAETPFGRISHSIYARQGWESRFFVLQDFTSPHSSTSSAEPQPTISVTQAIVRPHVDDWQLYELIETAQSALSEGRAAIGETLFRQIANAKWDTPILGLLAAHILLLADCKDQTTRSGAREVAFSRNNFEIILKNTAKLLGETHPDILALRTRSETMPLHDDDQVNTPPLFMRSWNLLLQASERDYPNLLRNSLWQRVRGNTNATPYFAWLRADSVFAEQRRATERRLAKEFIRVADSEPLRTAALERFERPGSLSSTAAQESLRSGSFKPDISNLADFAPKLDVSQLFTETNSLEDAVKQVSRFARLPYSVTENLLDHDALRHLLDRKDK